MDPKTGNIYTEDEAGELSIPLEELIPLDSDYAKNLIAVRQQAAVKLQERLLKDKETEIRRKKNKPARRARKRNR